MNRIDLAHKLTGFAVYGGDKEVLVRVLTRDDRGEVLRMQAGRIRLVSGTGDIIVEASDLKDEKP